MKLQYIYSSVFCCACLLFLNSTALAQIHADIDIEVENGILATSPRIGEGEFGEAPNAANVADEPGFEADDGVLNAGDVIGVNAVDVLGSHLWYWDGVGSVNFGLSGSTLDVEHPVTAQSMTLDSGDSGGVSGFDMGTADMDGGLHQDLEFVLSDATPAAGVYLFGLEMTSPNYSTSEPVYMVMASEVDEAVHEAAAGWVATTFNIPEPTTTLSGIVFIAWVLATQTRQRASRN